MMIVFIPSLNKFFNATILFYLNVFNHIFCFYMGLELIFFCRHAYDIYCQSSYMNPTVTAFIHMNQYYLF